MSDDEQATNEADSPLSDGPLLDLLDALVEGRGKVATAETLGVNYRTMMNCYDSRRVSRRMRRALREFHDAAIRGGAEACVGESDGDGEAEDDRTALSKHAAELEEENRELRELVEAQANRLKKLERQVAASEELERATGDTERVDDRDGRGHQREPGPADAGVVSLEKRPGDDDALGPAAALVNEWRELRNPAAPPGSRVKRAEAAVRRWELEIAMLRDFHLTLPPETEPLDDSRRDDHVRWRLEALAEARRELAGAMRGRWLRRALTLGLWRR